ncbi:GGDEF domain-containing protein [bacterium]|nr:GGDEF domain-containing protein [bacterium]
MDNNIFIDFITSFSNKILNCVDIYSLDNVLHNSLKEIDIIENIDFFVYEENTQKLKYFTKPWQQISQEKQKFLYERFCLLDDENFSTENDYYKITTKYCEESEKEIYFSIHQNDNKLGLIHFRLKKIDLSSLNYLLILKNIITLAYLNLTVSSKMEGNLSFYNAMKNIAKIIESQYEPTYVIPLIGEMIDRFVQEHLIYVFLKNENGYKLAWPNACKQQDVINALDDLSLDNEYFVMNDMQTGVFGLISENTILGAIVAYSNIDKLTHSQIDYIVQLAKQSAITLQRAYVYSEILEHATLDALTGLNNRRQFETRLSQEVATTKRKKADLCCIMLDVDHFKSVNDTYGHLAGDCVLKGVAQIVKNELREYDIACRYGGEEFIIILPFTAMNEAMFVAQRLRKTIEETNIDISDAKLENTSYLNITISAGVSSFDLDNDNPQTFYQKADAALYDAKNAGRNRVIAFV